jgi:acyl-CoA reductase-like NAD-dependent aldehyde dehydrogenase
MDKLISRNPFDDSVVGTVPVTAKEDIPGLVSKARAAQPAWAALGFEERADILRKAGEILAARSDQVGELMTREMGKPLAQARGEAGYAAKSFASELEEIGAALAPESFESGSTTSTVYKDAVGVVACIAPWNFPVLMAHQQILPALAAGNTVVFKPSEKTPLTGQDYADALLEVLPEGVLTIVHGAAAQGKALVEADVDLVVFTGSVAAGRHILSAAAPAMKRVLLELGGKDPLLVLKGADVGAAAKFAARNSFRNSGQVCISTERIYVDEGLHDDFVEKLVEAAAKLVVGDGLLEGTDLGPMVDATQRDHVVKQLEAARSDGATFAFEGKQLGGNLLSPTVLTDVTDEMQIFADETFGPVAAVVRVQDADEAVTRANASPYGLGAVVYGEPAQAAAVARRLDAGMVGVNQGLSGAGSTPWVGAKDSGYGFHSGHDGHRQFTQVRVVHQAKG